MKKKIVYVSSRPPFPMIGGREHMIVQSLKFLSEEFDVHVLCFHSRGESVLVQSILDVGVKSVELVAMAGSVEFVRNVFLRSNNSFQENLYYSKNTKQYILHYINALNPAVVICDMLRTSQFVKGLSVPLIVDFDDMLSSRYEKIINGNSEFSSLGTYADRLPFYLRWLESSARNLIVGFERRRIEAAECLAFQYADLIIFTSPVEARKANEKYNSNKALGISQQVNVTQNCICTFSNKNENIKLLFIGNMTTAQNLASLSIIVGEILPLLRVIPNLSLKVIGKFDQRAEYIIKNEKRVELLGFVENVIDVAQGCTLALMPVAFGTGVKTKVLDAMSMGLPVITNDVGAEGIDVVSGTNILIANSNTELATSVTTLLKSDALLADISSAGREYVNRFHSYSFLKNRYINFVKSVL